MLTQAAVIKLILNHLGGSKVRGARTVITEGQAVIKQAGAIPGQITDAVNKIGGNIADIRAQALQNPVLKQISAVKAHIDTLTAKVNSIPGISSDKKVAITTQLATLATSVDDFQQHTDILSGVQDIDYSTPGGDGGSGGGGGGGDGGNANNTTYVGNVSSTQLVTWVLNLRIAVADLQLVFGNSQTAQYWANAASYSASDAQRYANDAYSYATQASTSANTSAYYAGQSANSAAAAAVSAGIAAAQANSSSNGAAGYSANAANSAASAAASAFAANLSAFNAETYANVANQSANIASFQANVSGQAAAVAGDYANIANNYATVAAAAAVNAVSYSATAAAAAQLAGQYKDTANTYVAITSGFANAAKGYANTANAAIAITGSFANIANTAAGIANAAATTASNAAAAANAAITFAQGFANSANNYATAANASSISANIAAGSATVSANAAAISAGNANASAAAAATNAGIAANAALQANTYASAAANVASFVTASRDAANTSAAAAQTSALQANTAASNAGVFATQAANSAQTANTAASAASTSQVAAANSALAAAGNAASIAQSATIAQSYANSSAISANAASASNIAAGVTAAQLFPRDFQANGTYWTSIVTGSAAQNANNPPVSGTYQTVTNIGRTLQVTGNNYSLRTKGVLTAIGSRRYRIVAYVRTIIDAGIATGLVIPRFVALDENYANPTALVNTPVAGYDQSRTLFASDGWKVVAAEYSIPATPTFSFLAPVLAIGQGGTGSSPLTEIAWMNVDDVTGQVAADGFANAAATSAAQAAAFQNAAGSFANAASGSATSANTSAGIANAASAQAATSATQAANSASTANSSAAAAAISSGVAANSALAAVGSAAASANSASVAQTAANSAGTFANAASASAIVASSAGEVLKDALGRVLPSTFSNSGMWWTSVIAANNTGPSIATYPGMSVGTVNGIPDVLTITTPVSNVYPKFSLTFVPDRKTRITAYVTPVNNTSSITLYVAAVNATPAAISTTALTAATPITSTTNTTAVSAVFDHNLLFQTGVRGYIPYLRGGNTYVEQIVIEDVTSELAAANSANAAIYSAAQAATAANAASQSANASLTSAVQANTALSQAIVSAAQAANSATNANNSAAAAGFAQGAAANSAFLAAGSANAASGSAGQASTFANAAGTYANAAAASQVAASASYSGVLSLMNEVLPDQPAVRGNFVLPGSPPPELATAITLGNVVTDASEGAVLEINTPTTQFDTRGRLKVDPNRTYEITVRALNKGPGGFFDARFAIFNANSDVVASVAVSTVGYVSPNTWYTATASRSGTQIKAAYPTATYIRGEAYGDSNGSSGQRFATLRLRDITTEANANNSAAAAVTSAQNAAANANSSAQSATAAAASAIIANTAASDASTYASQAATSASNANGSSSSAGSSAGAAANSANNAAGSAAASANAVTLAQSQANAAAQSANAAAASQIAAGVSANNAAGSAITANTNANAAITAAQSAQAYRDAANTYAGAAQTFSLSANSSAGAANTSAGQAGIYSAAAANSASSANASAASAATSSLLAANSALNANTFAGAAAGSASSANSSANSAGSSAGAALASQISANAVFQGSRNAANFPLTFSQRGALYNDNTWGTGNRIPDTDFATGANGYVLSKTGYFDISYTRAVPVKGRLLKFQGRLRALTANANYSADYEWSTLPTYNSEGGSYSGFTNITPAQGWIAIEYIIDGRVANYPWNYISTHFRGTATGTVEVDYCRVIDLTEVQSAADSANAAIVSSQNASAFANAAGQSATTAQGYALTANTAAGNAGVFALQAANSATNANGSSAAAATSAGIAANSAGLANTSAAAAANSASSANTSANSAGQSAAAASASSVSAQSVATQLLPDRPAVKTNFTMTDNVLDTSLSASLAFGTVEVDSTQGQMLVGPIGGFENFYTKGCLPIGTGKTFKVTSLTRWRGGTSGISTVNFRLYGADGVALNGAAYTSLTLTAGGPWTEITATQTSAQLLAVAPTAVWVRAEIVESNHSGSTQALIAILRLEDTTTIAAAVGAANAASTFAQQASTFANNSAGYANASLGYSVQANTAAGQAATYALQAANSASNANGSYQNALISQGAAANSANTAGTSAQAAFNSAISANTFANSSAASANAAANSALVASAAAGNAASYAAVANGAAASANSSAASASSSSIVAASLLGTGGGVKNKNPNFAVDWTSGAPPFWNDWSYTTAYATKIATDRTASPYAIRIPGNANQNDGIVQAVGGCGPGKYVINAEIKLISGSLAGAGVLVQSIDSNGSQLAASILNFALDRDVSGSVVGGGVTGKTYQFSKIVDFVDPAASFINIYCMSHWDGIGSNVSANVIDWYKNALTVGDAIASAVVAVTSDVSVLKGKTTAYWQVDTNAGSGAAAFISARADTANGVGGSSVAMGATEIHISNPAEGGGYKKALSVSGGNVQIYGKLQANSVDASMLNIGTPSGARVTIDTNLIRVYDANNVLRVRLGVWG